MYNWHITPSKRKRNELILNRTNMPTVLLWKYSWHYIIRYLWKRKKKIHVKCRTVINLKKLKLQPIKYIPPQTPKPQPGYFYPAPTVRFELPTTRKPIAVTYLPPTTPPVCIISLVMRIFRFWEILNDLFMFIAKIPSTTNTKTYARLFLSCTNCKIWTANNP